MQFVKKRERSEFLHQAEQYFQQEEGIESYLNKMCLNKMYWLGYEVGQMIDTLNEHVSGKIFHDKDDILNKFRPLQIDLEDVIKCLPSGTRKRHEKAIKVLNEDVNNLGLALERNDFRRAIVVAERDLRWDIGNFLAVAERDDHLVIAERREIS
jgi:hypothetical protein